ncbi:acyltransferase [Knoellia sinensis KCTC 19936]|uniref:Acyltransferase n=1 Tax=Knoellia sinensis KCTC 19936 TaxID=1385520 RepID=A0A0A0JE90_9MICO|nr:GNAT family N-acetyltransferase [Knoellia sinensis]KGN33926.1 acyltransferase [Knoellia sinensis KCTC 19936]
MAEPAGVMGTLEMAEPVRVVPVTEDNLRTYRDVRLAALLDTPRAFANTYAVSAAYSDESWRARLTTMNVWLAFAGDRPVGTVAIYHDDEQPPEEIYLIGMWVSASVRGRGVGDLLVATALDAAREDGYARVHLEVAKENEPAQRLYERHGFAPTGTTWDNPLYGGICELGYALELR